MSATKRRPTRKGAGFWAVMASRPTSDLIVMILTAVVALAVLATVLAMVWIKVAHPEQDAAELGKQVGAFITSLIAVIVGYVAGRGVNAASPGERDTLTGANPSDSTKDVP